MKVAGSLAVLVVVFWANALHAANCAWVQPPTDMTVTTSYSVFSLATVSLSQSFSFRCSANSTAIVSLTRGINSTSFSPRTLLNSTPALGFTTSDNQLDYNLLNPSNQIWGNGSGGSMTVTFTATTADKVFNQNDGAILNAVLTGGQDKTPGTYSDQLTMSVDFGTANPLTATFNVFTTIVPECQVATFEIKFGPYDPVVANATTPRDINSTTVNVQCTKSVRASVALDDGASTSGPRQMTNITTTSPNLLYDVFIDSARTRSWNTINVNSGQSSSKAVAIGGGYTGYGRIPPGQNVAAGSYQDTMQAVVTY